MSYDEKTNDLKQLILSVCQQIVFTKEIEAKILLAELASAISNVLSGYTIAFGSANEISDSYICSCCSIDYSSIPDIFEKFCAIVRKLHIVEKTSYGIDEEHDTLRYKQLEHFESIAIATNARIAIWDERYRSYFPSSSLEAELKKSRNSRKESLTPIQKKDSRLLHATHQTHDESAHIDLKKLKGQLSHHLLINAEIPSIDSCSELILRLAGRMPCAFVFDMCSQIGDEARHAAFFYELAHECNIRIGDYKADPRLEDAIRDQPSELVLAIQQCLGEKKGAECAKVLIERWAIAGEKDFSNALQKILTDEERHVRNGYTWLKKLLDEDEEKISYTIDAGKKIRKSFMLD